MINQTKWTPGPWRVSSESPRIIQKDYRAIGSDAGFLIASTMGRDNSGFYASEQEADANANLIAAAPELYDVCERLLDAVPYVSEYDVPMGLWDDIRAALAKARGEA